MKLKSFTAQNVFTFSQKILVATCLILGFAHEISAQCGAGDVGGIVYLDLPMNGTSVGSYGVKASNEPGIQGITVTITDANGAVTTKTTDASGNWWVDSPVLPIRVEFSWKTTYPFYESSVVASGSNTSVQFISTSNCTTNFALHDPNVFTSSNPKIATTCFVNGTSTGTGGPDAAVVTVNYNATGLNSMYSNYWGTPGTGQMPNMDATINKVGSVYGVAYQKSKKRGFYATFLKRHAGILDGTGYIYVLDHSTTPATYSSKFNLNGIVPANGSVAINFGSVCRDASCGALASDYVLPADKTQPNVDLDAFGKVGRVSFGDIDMGPDGNTLFATNLNSNSIITVDVSGNTLPGTVKEYKVATLAGFPTSTKGALHIFALEFYNGKGYLGVTDDASITKLNSDLKCYVLEFDPNNVQNGFTQIISIDPNARKPSTSLFRFNYWINTYAEPPVTDEGYFLRFAQPILSDIEFDQYGNMYLSIMDRFGHQIGQANHKPVSGNGDYKSVQSFGDLLKACKTSTGYALEGTTGCTVASAEFFNDQSGDCSEESIVGSSLLLSGTDQIITTNFDPFPGTGCSETYWNTQGFNTFSTTSGNISNWYSVYYSGDTQLFGKANGLGDLELLADNAPIEIGNRIWKDLDNDGIQDPNEPALGGVTVSLFADGGTTPISTATTDANGNFIFSTASGTSSPSNRYGLVLAYNTNYDLKVTSLGSDPSVSGLLLTRLSPAPGETSGSNNTGSSLNNNDAFLISSFPMINLSTGNAGQNNHTYDFGFATCNVSVSASSNSSVCAGNSINLSSTATGASGGISYSWKGPNSFTSSVQNPTISSSSVANGGVYTITVTDGLGCSASATTNVVISSISVSKVVSACINQPLQDVATVDVTVSWTNAPLNDNLKVVIGNKTEIINVSTGSTSPQTIRFVVPANGVTNQSISVSWINNTSCPATTITFDAPVACSNDNLSCEKILYLCGPDKPADGDAFDHGLINYLLANNPSLLTPAFTKPDASGNGLYDVMNISNPLSVNLNEYSMIIVSPTTEANLATDLLNNLKGFSGGILMMNYLEADDLGLTDGAAFYNFQTNAYTNNTNQIEIYNYDNTNPTYSNVLTGGDYHAVGDAYLWFGANDMSAGNNGISFYYSPSDLLPSVSSTHGARAYLGYHMNGLYSNAQNGGTMPAPASSYFVPTNHLTVDGKYFLDQAIKSVATGVSVIAKGDTVCVGNTVSLSAMAIGSSSYTWTGPNGFTSTSQNPIISNASVAATGTYTVTINSGTTCSATATTHVLINQATAPTSTGASRCGDGTLTLTATGCVGGTISWYGSLTGGSALTTGVTYTTPSLTNTTNYYLECTLNNCTSTTRNVATATINPVPTGVSADSNSPIRTGNTINLSANGGGTYLWNGPNSFTSTSQNPSISNAQQVNEGTYTVTITATGGCTATVTTNVVVYNLITEPLPPCTTSSSLTATSNSPINAGNTLNLSSTSTNAIDYAWQGPNSFTSISQNPTILNATTQMAGIYTVTVTPNGQCSETSTVQITIGCFSSVSASSNSPVCEGQTLNLSASAAQSYSWEGPNGFISTLQNPTISNVSPLASGIYGVTLTGTGGCTVLATVNVTINELPVVEITGTQNLTCATTSVARTASGGGTYLWSGPSAFTATSATINATIAGTYTVTVTNGSGCTATATTTVSSNTTPPAASIIGNSNLSCTNSSVSRTAQLGETYQWSGPNSFNETTATINVSVAGNYTVTVTGSNGCTATATTAVTADTSFPNISITTTEDTLTCNVTSAVLTATVTPAGTYTYVWSNSSVGSGITVYEAGTYTVTVTGNNGCSATASITINEINTVTAIMTVTPVSCKGGNNGKIVVTPIEGKGPFEYKLDNGVFQSSNTFDNLIASNYSIIVKDAGGCTASTQVTVTEPLEDLKVSVSSTTNPTCFGGNNGGLTASATGGTTDYTYSIGGTFQSSGVFTALSSGNFTITAKDSKGCTATATTSLSEPSKIIPTITGSEITCSVTTGTISVSATGGTGAYSYSKDGSTFQSGNQFTGLVGGNYIITIKDANNCIVTATTAITVGDTTKPAYSAIAISSTCLGNVFQNNGKITLSGFTAGQTHQYNVGTAFNSGTATPVTAIPNDGVIVSNLANPTSISESYTIRVYNSNGCYKDVVVNLLQTVCDCKPAICIPVSIKKQINN